MSYAYIYIVQHKAICIFIRKSILLTLAERCALASRRASVYSDPIINSCDLYANSGHFFRRGNGGSFVGPAGQPVKDRKTDRLYMTINQSP